MNKHRKTIFNIINIIVIILLILLFHFLFEPFEVARRRLEMPQYDIYRTLMRLDMLAIGIAIEGKRLYIGLKDKLNVNWVGLIISLFFVLLSMVPLEIGYDIGMSSIGYSLNNPIQTISWIVVRGISWNIVSLLGGIGIIRSITYGPIN
jgi:putative Mn2+ efflux pump MntP